MNRGRPVEPVESVDVKAGAPEQGDRGLAELAERISLLWQLGRPKCPNRDVVRGELRRQVRIAKRPLGQRRKRRRGVFSGTPAVLDPFAETIDAGDAHGREKCTMDDVGSGSCAV